MDLQGDQLAADRPRALRLLTQACNEVLERSDVQSVILGGAGVAGIAAEIQGDIAVPVIDSVYAGVGWALEQRSQTPTRTAPGFDVPWENLSSELMQMSRKTV